MEAVERMLAARSDHVLEYDERAARIYAELLELRRTAGHPLSVEDGMIAAICRMHRADLATRNTRDFAGLGISLIDPWSTADQ